MNQMLAQWIYEDQTPDDLIRPAWMARWACSCSVWCWPSRATARGCGCWNTGDG